jgi:hypothetical protein
VAPSRRSQEPPWQPALESARANIREADRSIEASRRRGADPADREAARAKASAHLDVAAWHMRRAAAAGASPQEIRRGTGAPSVETVEAVLRDGNALRLAAGDDLPDVGSWEDGRFAGPAWPGADPG